MLIMCEKRLQILQISTPVFIKHGMAGWMDGWMTTDGWMDGMDEHLYQHQRKSVYCKTLQISNSLIIDD